MATRRSRSSRRTQCGWILLLFTVIAVITFTRNHSDETAEELDMKAMQKELYAHQKKQHGHQEEHEQQYLLRSSAHASEEENDGGLTVDVLQDDEESPEVKIEQQASEEEWPQTNHAAGTVHKDIASPSELDPSVPPDDTEASEEEWPQTNHAGSVREDITSPSELDPSASPEDQEASEEEWPQTEHAVGTVHKDIASPSELDPSAPSDDKEASEEEWPQTNHAGTVREGITSTLDSSASPGDKKSTATEMGQESEEEQIDPPKMSYTAASEKLTLSGSQDGGRSPEIKSELLRGRQPTQKFVHVSKNGGALIDIKRGITRN